MCVCVCVCVYILFARYLLIKVLRNSTEICWSALLSDLTACTVHISNKFSFFVLKYEKYLEKKEEPE